eukprot:6189661-Pleurochrysis_carterae.AAC.2
MREMTKGCLLSSEGTTGSAGRVTNEYMHPFGQEHKYATESASESIARRVGLRQHTGASLLHGADEIALEPGLVALLRAVRLAPRHHACSRSRAPHWRGTDAAHLHDLGAGDGRVANVRVLRRRVVPPDAHACTGGAAIAQSRQNLPLLRTAPRRAIRDRALHQRDTCTSAWESERTMERKRERERERKMEIDRTRGANARREFARAQYEHSPCAVDTHAVRG